MKAEDIQVARLLDGAKQFIVPVFQRDYSWGTKQCKQLWQDLVRVAVDSTAKGHFLGSVVYIAAEDNSAGVARWLLIDGQQRLTTITLLLIALRNELKARSFVGSLSPEELDDYFLRNRHGKDVRRYKLHLRRADQDTLVSLIDGKVCPELGSERIQENYRYLADQLANYPDLDRVYEGIKKFVVVDVCLTRGQDNPQMIFESLNSTGLNLTQSDLIRNFVLMKLEVEVQTRFYREYWQPIETAFGRRYRSDFDKFVRDFLNLQLSPSKPFKSDQIYAHFRTYFGEVDTEDLVEKKLQDLRRFGRYYAAFSFGTEKPPVLKNALVRLRGLGEVVSPIVLRLYDCFDRTQTLSEDEFVSALELLESYVFRRSVCDMQANSLGQIFANLAHRIKEAQPLDSLKAALARQPRKRRFPVDTEFREALENRDVYGMRNCSYLLDRLENFKTNERIDTSSFTIEHVLPQNDELRPEWQTMLGTDWKRVQETWLHRLGNVTLTGYNPDYSDKPFDVKKSLTGKGFNDSPLRLHRSIREQTIWTASEIEQRGKLLAEKAVDVWPSLVVDSQSLKQSELEERVVRAAGFTAESLTMDAFTRGLFEILRPHIQELGSDIVELPNEQSVVYAVYDFFIEVIPRKHRLSLLLNLDFDSTSDASGKAGDASQYAFVVNASEAGGVLFSFDSPADLDPAMHLIRQAYQVAAE